MEKKILDRFMAKVQMEPNTGCWLWSGLHDKQKYGIAFINQKGVRAHRLSYMIFKGNFDNKLLVRHKCDTPSCVNPDHLLTGTVKDNSQDCVSRRRHRSQKKTHCVNGHEFNSQNTWIRSSRNGSRECRVCKKIRMRNINAAANRPS